MKFQIAFALIALAVIGAGSALAQPPPEMATVTPASVTEVPWIAPSVKVTTKNLLIEGDRLILEYPCLSLVQIGGGDSMVPISAVGHLYIVTTCFELDDIQVGDIVVFKFERIDLGKVTVLHQVVELGSDEVGWYAVTRGTNVMTPDLPIREEDLKYIGIGVLW